VGQVNNRIDAEEMGGQSLSKQEVEQYREISLNKLAKEDIKRYHRLFHDMFPKGEMDQAGFRKYIYAIQPETPKDAKLDHLFRAMDRDRNGSISFHEYILFQAITVPTQAQQKASELIDMAFEMYDEDGNGEITEAEMNACLEKCFYAKGLDAKSPQVQNIIKNRISNLLKLADADGDGRITRDEIQRAAASDPSIVNIF